MNTNITILIIFFILFLILFLLINVFKKYELFDDFKNTTINYYVITLNQESRLNNIKIQEEKLAKPINIITGINGLSLDQKSLLDNGILSKDFYILNDNKRAKEIGCYQSHLSIYNLINKNTLSDYSVIFEDDFDIKQENLNLELENIIKSLDNNFDIIYLGNTFDNVGTQFKNNIYSIDKNKFSIGTFAYLVNNKNIKKIIGLTELIDRPIDIKLDYLIKNSLLTGYVIFPNLVSYKLEIPSTINT
jgi:GR25 family glycosyltransferase involved in LPS biosynthesis